MQKAVSPKIVVLTFGVLVILFAIGFYVVAWQEPGSAPPSGNVAAPLNTGTASQTKSGALTIAAGGGDALILRNGGDLRLYNSGNTGSALLYSDYNNVLITPGDLRVGNATIAGSGVISTNLNADRLDNYHAADLLAQAGGGGSSYIAWGTGCASGWTTAYTGLAAFPFAGTYAGGMGGGGVICVSGIGFENYSAGMGTFWGGGNSYYSSRLISCAMCIK